jgi:hypothetical protein
MHTISDKTTHQLVEFNDGFDSREIMELIHHEAFIGDEPKKNSIWHIGKHTSRLHMGELPIIVDHAAQLPLKHMKDRKTAIVTEHSSTRTTMQMLADGLQHRLPVRCRTFKTIEEAHRWLDYVNSQTALPSSDPSIS